MHFIIKYFPEITIKSRPVRKRFVKQLRVNLRNTFRASGLNVEVLGGWDKISVITQEDEQAEEIIDVLSRTQGISYFLEVVEHELGDFHDVYEKTAEVWLEKLAGKTFCVRCKRAGNHEFKSNEIEQYVGGGLNQHSNAAGVKLKNPDITVNIEIRNDKLYVVKEKHVGLGGFPLGAVEPCLSLISGGFDSTVSSFLMMRRGLPTHFCFFNLGGRDHEVAVKEVAYYLWSQYGATRRVKFVAVPFEDVVTEILQAVHHTQMGVVLKRMMLRAAAQVAEKLAIEGLVTGESVAQVSSQTVTNLNVIDRVTNTIVMRPLITMDKGEIIDLARKIGTEDFAKHIPEYCGVISDRPTTKAKLSRIEHEESEFNFEVLDDALARAEYINIDELAEIEKSDVDVEIISELDNEMIIIDVRHPDEEDRHPLDIPNEVIKAPFYSLQNQFALLDQNKKYYLYCDKGVMSRLHAHHLAGIGFDNVAVYRPN